MIKLCLVLPADKPVNPRSAASYSRLIRWSSRATSLFCSFIVCLLLATLAGLSSVQSSLMTSITGDPHLCLTAIHSCSYHFHDHLTTRPYLNVGADAWAGASR